MRWINGRLAMWGSEEAYSSETDPVTHARPKRPER
jgi:hypothetical protein